MSVACKQCFASLALTTLVSHHKRFHSSYGQASCTGCRFQSEVFADAVTHGLIEGHQLSERVSLTHILPLLEPNLTREPEHTPEKLIKTEDVSKTPEHHIHADEKVLQNQTSTCSEGITSIKPDPGLDIKTETTWNDVTTTETDHNDVSTSEINQNDVCVAETARNESSTTEMDTNAVPAIATLRNDVQSQSEPTILDPEEYSEVDQSVSNQTLPLNVSDLTLPLNPELKLCCKKCRKTIKCQQIKMVSSGSGTNRVDKAIRHVTTCLNVKPYACSSCQYRSNRKDTLARHIKRGCNGAVLVIVEKNVSEMSIKKGLKMCFPGENLAWSELGMDEDERVKASV